MQSGLQSLSAMSCTEQIESILFRISPIPVMGTQDLDQTNTDHRELDHRTD